MARAKLSYRIFGYDRGHMADTLALFKRYGITSVVGHGDVEAACYFSENGIDYYVMHKCFHADESIGAPENLCVDIEGRTTKWFGSACPNNPAVREKSMADAKALAKMPRISGVITDGGRFASPASAEGANAFFTCFCGHCQAKMAALGFDPDMIRSSVAALYTHGKTGQGFRDARHGPGIDAWLAFRRAAITEYYQRYTQTVRNTNPSLQVGAYLFTPSLSMLVGQSHADCAGLFDFLSPMIYRHYDQPEGPACLDHEIIALLNTVRHLPAEGQSPMIALYERLTGLPFAGMPGIDALRRGGCPVSYVEREVRRAKECIADRAVLVPIILLKDTELQACMDACRKHGVATIDFFRYDAAHLETYLPRDDHRG